MSAEAEDEGVILLIGASGQLGGEFVKQFRRYRVPLVMTSSDEDFRLAFDVDSAALSHPGVETYPRWRQLDVSRPEVLRRLIEQVNPRLVINASAYTAVDKAESDQANAHAINAHAPQVMAEVCASLGAVLVHFSTDYVFDGSASHAYTERDAAAPVNAYGLSKLRGEQAVLALDAGHFVFRTSWLYTPGGANFVTTMLRLFRGDKTVRVVDDQVGSPTWAQDLAAVVTDWLMGNSSNEIRNKAGLYHLCSAGQCSWYEFATAIYQRMDPPSSAQLSAIDSATFGALAERPLRSVLDCTLAKEQLELELPHWLKALETAMPTFNELAQVSH